jgi:hypothetical protein
MIDSLNIDDFIPINEFDLKWRFTEEKYSCLSEQDLSLIQPLSEHRAKEFNRYSQKYMGNGSLLESEFSSVESLKISGGHEAVRDWLRAKSIDPETKVAVSWDNTDCVITLWRVFIKYWDDFCYPISDDILVWSSTEDWFLYYCHHEIFEYGKKKS